ncbi:MAG: hypothetical protein OEM98_16855 [Gammaproteobacteria bacterium]|nr:hypothetical protein [Gammaproteobacteria bacterium]
MIAAAFGAVGLAVSAETMGQDLERSICGFKEPFIFWLYSKKMGHAGAIVMGNKGTYQSKRKALERAGVRVLDTPSDVGKVVKEALE